MIFICLAVALSLTSQTSSSALPRANRVRHGYIRPADLPFQNREVSKFHDAPDRRQHLPIYLLTTDTEEKPVNSRQKPFNYKIVDLDDRKMEILYKLIGLKPTKHQKKVIGEQKRFKKLSNDRLQGLNKYFDKNGMFYITKPKAKAEDRELNYLLSKVIENNVLNNNIWDDDNTLRNPPAFTHKELEKLKQISRALQSEPDDKVNSLDEVRDDAAATPRTVFRFDELVA